MHSIRIKTAAITIVAILTSILSVFAACYSTIQRENNRRSVETMRLIAVDTQKTLEKYFESIEQSLEMVVNIGDDLLDSVVLAENGVAGDHGGHYERTPQQAEQLDAYLAGYCARVQETFSSIASRTYGIVTYYYCINPEISQEEHGFFFSMVGKTGFYEQPPLDARELDPDDLEHTTWYYTPIQRGRPSWIGPYKAHFLGEMLTCSYLVPIYKAGALIGVMGMDIPFETLIEQVRPIRVYETGYACLYDEEGHVLYHPELPFGSIPEKLDPTVDRALLRGKDSGDRLIRYMDNDEQRQMCFTTLSNGMKLVLTAPVKEINASWTQLGRIVLLITAAVILFYAVLVLFVMRLITRPLVRLTAASKRLADEDYDVELRYDSKDEVGILTSAFKQMRDKLKRSIDDLNHRVYYDSLTGLPNMRCFFKQAESEKKRLTEEGKNPVLLYFNLIGMRHYNRQYGFEEGDKLIREIGGILSRCYAQRCLCRFSEDHFAVLTDDERLEESLEAFFQEILDANGGNSLPVRVGIYPMRLEDVTVSVACDRAKYASDRYRNAYLSGFYYFDESMLREAENVRYVISHLDRALAERWIKVYYQPIVRAVNGRVCDEEALSRWVDPTKGVLSPSAFIPILEDARLIYKLDLYVLDEVLEKMNLQLQSGQTVVPHSINLSRSDFDVCDIVEEIRNRVDAAGIGRDKISIEITESMIGRDFAFMEEQIRRFQEFGFPVWMDDFGSGYSTLDVLHSIRFNLIKFDMSFVKKLDEGERSKIILTDLMQMATSLGVDTVCEGVETESQVQFLREIGCSKLQGFYFSKPVPFETIQESASSKTHVEYENPKESVYYEAIGRMNLGDFSMMASGDDVNFEGVFNTIPMGVIEIMGDKIRFVRSNQSYRNYIRRYFGVDLSETKRWLSTAATGLGVGFIELINQNAESSSLAFLDEKMPDGSTVHSFTRRIAVNPVTGATASAIAVLSITEKTEGATYAGIAKALASDYYNIYYVNLETDDFIEYSSPIGGEELAVERRGRNFFASSRRDTMTRIFEADREAFLSAFTKENILREIDEQGVFTVTYRLVDSGEPMYVNMKITRTMPDRKHLIIGISIIDSQMKQKQADDRLRQERTIYERIAALSGGFLSLYTVDPETGNYIEFSATEDYASLGLPKEGTDFFGQCIINGERAIYAEDLPAYNRALDRENLLRSIRENGVFTMRYRLMINDVPVPVLLRAAMVQENDGEKLIVGVYKI